jgi:hypothetical protein
MRLVLACVLGWFVIAAGGVLVSRDADAVKRDHAGRHERSGSLIVAVTRPGF